MNNKKENDYSGDKFQNYFTAYLEQALKNNRISYWRKKQIYQKSEILYSTEEQFSVNNSKHKCLFSDIDLLGLDRFGCIQNTNLAEELARLPEKTISIIYMRIIDGYSYKIISSKVGIKENTVRTRYWRAIQKIRNNMKGKHK